jgi:alpha-beta hydrolase superfamily lysophospholipase
MAQPRQETAVASWTEPEWLVSRGTLIIVPGRGEQPEVYERFGHRISSDAYRVHVVADPVPDAALTERQVKDLLDGPAPVVLAGSDTGALYATGLVASGQVSDVDALILAGLPVTADGGPPAS